MKNFYVSKNWMLRKKLDAIMETAHENFTGMIVETPSGLEININAPQYLDPEQIPIASSRVMKVFDVDELIKQVKKQEIYAEDLEHGKIKKVL